MKQSDEQVPAEQTSLMLQLVPLARLVHDDVLVPGWQLWHALLALTVPEG